MLPALKLDAKYLLFGEHVYNGNYWPRYHTYLSKGGKVWGSNHA